MDQLKALGITIGEPSLVKSVKSYDETLVDAIKKGGLTQDRKGSEDNFRDRLEKSLQGTQKDPNDAVLKAIMDRPSKPSTLQGKLNVPSKVELKHTEAKEGEKNQGEVDKFGQANLKNTHGEQFHSDNDKEVEKEVTTAEEIDRVHETERETDHAMVRRSMSKLGKTIDATILLVKSLFPDQILQKEMKYEPTKKDIMGQIAWKIRELKELKDSSWVIETEIPEAKELAEKRFSQIKNEIKELISEHGKAKKSDLDSVYDLVKGGKGYDKVIETVPEKPVKKLAALHENSPGMVGRSKTAAQKANQLLADHARKSFIKSSGQGGMLFDFGTMTGNKIADDFTAILQRHSDPVQNNVAAYQAQAMDRAVMEYTKKGESGHTNPVHAGWDEQLNKPMDQQVAEAFKKGELDDRASFPTSHVAKTENVAGMELRASSATDAAVLEMFKAEQASMRADTGGLVADATSGGKQNITIEA